MIGLPSLESLDHSATTRIWLATAPADMRCGFDRLAELAQVRRGGQKRRAAGERAGADAGRH